MYITRGTTPTHIFTLPLSVEQVHDLLVTYTQANRVVLEKVWVATDSDTSTEATDPGVSIESIAGDKTKSEVNISLTADETSKKFDPKHFVKLQLSVSEKVEKALPSGEKLITSGDIHKSDIIYLAVLDDLSQPYVPESSTEEETE